MLELKLPELGENIDAVEVAAVLVSVGDLVRAEQPILEVETEKASLEVPSGCDGRIAELLVAPGDSVRVGQVLARIDPSASTGKAPERPAEPVAAEPAPAPPEPSERDRKPVTAAVIAFPTTPSGARPRLGVTVPAAPSTRALARELGVDVAGVRGSGPGGRISRADVKAHVKSLIRGAGAPGAAGAAPVPLPDFTRWGDVRRERLSSVRRATARRMANSWSSVPHVTQFDHADITRLEARRKEINRGPEAAGSKLTVTAIVIQLVAAALKQFPKFTASLDLDDGAVIYKEYLHLGVAVDTERGLLVPVIRDVDRKSLPQIAARLDELARRARERKLSPDEMRGATFTVTNLGGLGTTYFSPIVNWPEVAILGVGRAEVRPVHADGKFEPRLILPLSLSYDHRWIDGADAARFLRWLAEALEQPLRLRPEE